jgi:menaquinone-dependent protoporphyrinogen oxidase
VFPGKLDRAKLGFTQRAIVAALHAPDGDFRDRGQIEAWAKEISATLR